MAQGLAGLQMLMSSLGQIAQQRQSWAEMERQLAAQREQYSQYQKWQEKMQQEEWARQEEQEKQDVMERAGAYEAAVPFLTSTGVISPEQADYFSNLHPREQASLGGMLAQPLLGEAFGERAEAQQAEQNNAVWQQLIDSGKIDLGLANMDYESALTFHALGGNVLPQTPEEVAASRWQHLQTQAEEAWTLRQAGQDDATIAAIMGISPELAKQYADGYALYLQQAQVMSTQGQRGGGGGGGGQGGGNRQTQPGFDEWLAANIGMLQYPENVTTERQRQIWEHAEYERQMNPPSELETQAAEIAARESIIEQIKTMAGSEEGGYLSPEGYLRVPDIIEGFVTSGAITREQADELLYYFGF